MKTEEIRHRARLTAWIPAAAAALIAVLGTGIPASAAETAALSAALTAEEDVETVDTSQAILDAGVLDSITSGQEAATAAAAYAASLSADTSVPLEGAVEGDTAAALNSADLPAAPDCEIIYLFDDGAGGYTSYTITSEIAMTLMMTNADGSYYIDPATGYYVCDYEKMQGFFTGLDFLFSVDGSSNTGGFVTTDGDVLADYDSSFQSTNVLDADTEIAYLSVAIMEQRKEAHFPTYRAGGGTYIEISIAKQTLYYYENGVMKFTCPVVTGNVSAGHSTPTGVYSVRGKARNITLVGSGYSSFVSYWMNFIGNSHGLHDASWRSSFGGDIYLTNGSHGCVNIPPSQMPELYEMVEVGTPVILY